MGAFDNLLSNGVQALQQGNLIVAIALLTQAITMGEEEKEEAQARWYRAEALLNMGDANSADEDAQWLLDHHEQPAENVFLLKARILHLKGDDETAIIYYNKVIEANPNLAVALKERGAIYLKLGNKEKAEQDMQLYLKANPQEVEAVNGEFNAEGKEGGCYTHTVG